MASIGVTPDHGENLIDLDPLIEIMNSVVHLNSAPTTRPRERRFSDTDRPAIASPPTRIDPVAVRSRDGTRWLPAPDHQSRTVCTSSTLDSGATGQPSTSIPVEEHCCGAEECAMTRLFETTELLELILAFLGTKDVLNLRRTSKRWNATITTSPHLRLRSFVYPQHLRPPVDFQLLPLGLPGLSIDLGEPLRLGRWIDVTMTAEAARCVSPEWNPGRRIRARSIHEGLRGGLGSSVQSSKNIWPGMAITDASNKTINYADLFITQPPLLGMQGFVTIPPSALDGSAASSDQATQVGQGLCAKISCDAGITLGFLADTTHDLLNSVEQAEEGTPVKFKAIVSFCPPQTAPRTRSAARMVTKMRC